MVDMARFALASQIISSLASTLLLYCIHTK